MKSVNKIIFCITILIVLFIILIPNNIMAFDTTGLGNLNQYRGDGGTSAEFDKIVNKIVKLVQIAGSIISVITLIVIGIRYMFASVEERASYKSTMMPYILGAFMVFGISNVTGLLYDLAKNIF